MLAPAFRALGGLAVISLCVVQALFGIEAWHWNTTVDQLSKYVAKDAPDKATNGKVPALEPSLPQVRAASAAGTPPAAISRAALEAVKPAVAAAAAGANAAGAKAAPPKTIGGLRIYKDRAEPSIVPMSVPAPEPPCRGCTPVFYPGLIGSRCFRIPAIIRLHTGVLLAAAESRIAGCADNGGRNDLVARRSWDDGRTWGKVIIIHRGEVPCFGCPAAASNPNLLEVNFMNGSYAVLLHFDTLNNPTLRQHGLDKQTWSYDQGLTWTKPQVLRYPPMENVGGMIGPSSGLQGASGTIYFSARAVKGDQHYTFIYFSRDFGVTWKAATNKRSEMPPFENEGTMAFLVSPEDERIVMNFRTAKKLHHRVQVIFDEKLRPKTTTWPKGLIDSSCQGSLINVDDVLYFSNVNHTQSRRDVTVKFSKDHGKTWSNGLKVHSGPAAYSQLVPLERGRLGLLLEAGKRKPEDTLSFMILSTVKDNKITVVEDHTNTKRAEIPLNVI